jgi:hypothetical protein
MQDAIGEVGSISLLQSKRSVATLVMSLVRHNITTITNLKPERWKSRLLSNILNISSAACLKGIWNNRKRAVYSNSSGSLGLVHGA